MKLAPWGLKTGFSCQKKFTNHHVVATLIQHHRASLSRREPWLERGLKACLPLGFSVLLLLGLKCFASITQMLRSSPSLKDPYRVVQSILQGSREEKGSKLKTNFWYKEKRPPGKVSKTWIAGQPAEHGGIRYLQVMESYSRTTLGRPLERFSSVTCTCRLTLEPLICLHTSLSLSGGKLLCLAKD